MAGVFHYLALRTSCHATEDPDKVLAGLAFVLGEDAAPEPLPEGVGYRLGSHLVQETRLDGHFGNPIRVFEVELKRNPDIDAFFQRIAAADPPLLRTMHRQLDRRLDDGLNFYLRLGKQEAYGRRHVLGYDEDSIQVRGKVAAFPAKLPAARKRLQEYLEGLTPAA